MIDKTQILVIIPTFNSCGGMESFIMNYYRHMDHSKVQLDFLTHNVTDNFYINEVNRYGSRVYRLPTFSISSLKEIQNLYEEILNNKKYDVVHCNMANAAFLYLKIAKKHNIPLRILHSHQDKAADTISHSIRNYPLLKIGKKYANLFLACSKNAGDFLFKNDEYIILNNAIDYSKYPFDEKFRRKMRKELNISSSTIVIGHTGRLCPQKNQSFLLKIVSHLIRNNNDILLLLIGDGQDEQLLKNQVKELNIQNNVMFLGSRNDVNDLLQAMDVFVFPSIYEGLGISVLESQANGLPTICSNGVPLEANISGDLIYMDLDDPIDKWANVIQNNLSRKLKVKLSPTYDIYRQANILENIYLNRGDKND